MSRGYLSCADNVRVIFVVINSVFFVIGAATLYVGIDKLINGINLVEYINLVEFASKVSSVINNYDITNLIKGAVYVLTIDGFAIIGVVVVGCSGGIGKIKRHLIIYAVIGCVIILAEVAVVVVAYLFTRTVDTNLQSYMLTALQSKYSSSLTLQGKSTFTYSYADDLTQAIDIVQLQFSCCGVIDGSDYSSASAWNKSVTGSPVKLLIPASCCRMNDSSRFIMKIKSARSESMTLTNSSCPFYGYASNMNTGCYSAIKSSLKDEGFKVLGFSAGKIFIQLLLAIYSCCLSKSADS